MLLPWLRGLVVLAIASNAAAGNDRCNDTETKFMWLKDAPKVAQKGQHQDGQLDSLFSFNPEGKNLSIVVTPANSEMDPDIYLYARTGPKECRLVTSAQDYGGDVLVIPNETTKQLNATRYYLRVLCRSPNCSFHVSVGTEHSKDTPEEIQIGQTKSGIAYRGVPLHFTFNCTGECSKAAVEESNRRLTFSVWPRDATSVHQLRLLVRKGLEPTTVTNGHLKATRGWFSGEVVGTPVEGGVYHIVVVKRHGHNPMPFVLSVTLPNTIQQIPLGKPFFGAVGRDQMAFYKFQVEDPNTDIQVYLTKLDGDPDMAVSNGEVHSNPTPHSAQWFSRKAGDDEILIAPDDPKRQKHPTGWFHVGVHGYKHTSFSLIALAEPHLSVQDLASRRGEVIDWTELWLGLPQTLSAWPGHAGNFLFYSQMVTPRLFVQIQVLEGPRPDACMALCGSDPHFCAYISPFASPAIVAAHEYGAVSNCQAGTLRGENSDSEVTVAKPCSSCWYGLLVTSEAIIPSETVVNQTANRSKFRVLLGAEGRAHPLVAGEPFRGHVDANDTAVLLVFDVPAEEVKNRSEANSTLRFVMTTLYGDPMFAVYGSSESLRAGEDGILLFASNASGRDDFSMRYYTTTKPPEAATYHIRVWAATKHARFRMQVFWEFSSIEALAKLSLRDFAGFGFPVLRSGRAQDGIIQAGHPGLFLYEPTLEGQNTTRPTIRVTCSATGRSDLRLWVRPMDTENKTALKSALDAGWQNVQRGEVSKGWVSQKGSNVLTIAGWDPQYVAPGGGCYVVAVFSDDNTGNVSFTVEVSTVGTIEELPLTGTRRPGAVAAEEYKRYKLELPDAGVSLSVTARAIAGDVDLYFGPKSTVGRGTSIANSTMVGSDSVFIPAFDQAAQKYCNEQVIAAQGECIWYAAVLGVSKVSEYEISAVVQDGRPMKLAPNSDALVLMPVGAFLCFYLALSDPMRPMTLQVKPQGGSLSSMLLKVVSRANARRPAGLAKLSAQEASLHGSFYAGVWSMRLEPKDLRGLCDKPEVKADGSGCVGLVVLHSAEGYWGRIALLTSTTQPEPQATSPASPGAAPSTEPGPKVLMLEAGVPTRGSLRTTKDLLVYGFLVSETAGDLEVTLTPLTNCTPELLIEFPPPENGNDGQVETMSPPRNPELHFYSVRITATDPRFHPGLYRFWTKQKDAAICEFDLRVQVDVSESPMADFSDVGVATPLTLLPNVPVYSSGNRQQFFVFTSVIPKAADAPSRKKLDVTFTVLEGELQVGVAALTSDGDDSATKKERLDEAIGGMKLVEPEGSWGSPQLFTCRDLEKWCGEALRCQLLIRVNTARPGRFADYIALANDQGSSRRPEVLLLGVPVTGCVGGKCTKGSASLFQLYVTNPSASVHVQLTCQVQGSGDAENCKHLRLSGDAPRGMKFRKYKQRFYKPPTDQMEKQPLVQELNLTARPTMERGRCSAPCVLLIYVEAPRATDSPITFELSANTQDAYTLLIDGDEPVMRTAQRSRPEYFLFDSRRASPLLTLLVTLPYDVSDPHGGLVSVFTLDCDPNITGSQGAENAEDALTQPSAEHYKYRSFANSRGQLLTFIRRGPMDVSMINEGRHCYYRIAVISQRMKPVTFAIRGFDWHPALPLVLDEPLEGMVDAKHSYQYNLQGSTDAGHVVLSLEVCSGSVRLLTSSGSDNAERSLKLEGGLLPTDLSLQENRLVELQAASFRFSTYILTAEDPARRMWLEPRPSSQLDLLEEEGGFTLTWSPARLFGAEQPVDGSGSGVQYEVFYVEATRSLANTSTPCGLYRDYEYKRATRIDAREKRRLTINDLQAGENYTFNVVAKSTKTGHAVAYRPYTRFVMHDNSYAKWIPQHGGSSMFWGQAAPLLVMGISVAFFIFARPCCKGHHHSSWRRFELELPSWERRARHIDACRLGSSGVGNYAPPAVVGVGGTPYSQI